MKVIGELAVLGVEELVWQDVAEQSALVQADC